MTLVPVAAEIDRTATGMPSAYCIFRQIALSQPLMYAKLDLSDFGRSRLRCRSRRIATRGGLFGADAAIALPGTAPLWPSASASSSTLDGAGVAFADEAVDVAEGVS